MTHKPPDGERPADVEARVRAMRERHARAVADTQANPPGFYRQPDKFQPMPGYDPARADLDPIERIIAPSEPKRLLGALLGLAAGDAMGTTLEFQSPPAPPFPQMATGPHTSVTGGGPFGVAPGQVTDDTQMACCLFQSILDRRELDVDDLARRYVAWAAHAFDIGNQTAAALAQIQHGMAPVAAGRAVWEARGRQAAGNGSLMRTAPIGVLLAATEDLRRRASLLDSAITHFDLRCQLACAALNAAIARAVRRDLPALPERRSELAGELWNSARQELDTSAQVLCDMYADLHEDIERARAQLADDLDAAHQDDPGLYGPALHLHKHQGFVRVAFRLAFWQLVHAPDFPSAIIDVANRGGDADTNAAITGALLGAVYGIDGIPWPWLEAVLAALQDRHDTPLARDYHPRLFVAGLERLYGQPILTSA